MKKMFLLAAGLALFAAPAPVLANATCLEVGSIYSWDAPNDKTLIVEDNFHNKFKLTLLGVCSSLTFKETLAFQAFGGTQLSCVSAGDSVYTRNFGTGRQQCPIRKVEPYTPAMMKADADAAAAKKAAEAH